MGSQPSVALSVKDALLLAMVAIDGPLARERVGQRLWPRSSPEQQRNSLRQRLHRLRERTGFVLVTYEAVLRWRPEVTHDLQTYADLAAWPERFMLGCDEVDAEPARLWLQQQREARTAQRHAALSRRLDALEGARAWPEAMALAQQWVDSERGTELPASRLARLRARMGERVERPAIHPTLARPIQGAYTHAEPSAQGGTAVERQPAAPAAALTPHTAAETDVRRWLGHPPLLVGRDAELRAMADAQSRRHHIVLVGEAGIGKSRLAQTWVATRGPCTLAAARLGDAHMPYALAARIVTALQAGRAAAWPRWARAELARIAPQLGEVAPGALVPAKLQAAFALACAEADAICVEDLHFADDASVELLAATLAGAKSSRWLLSTRPDATSPVLRSWLDALAGQGLVLTLGPWPESSLSQLLTAVGALAPELGRAVSAQAMQRHTGGVPLFVLRTLEQMWAEGAHREVAVTLPRVSGVQALIARRVRGLPDDALALLRTAAIAGADFSLGLAAAVLGRHPTALTDAWRLLVDALLMHEQGIAHDLVADVARETIPEAVAQWMHAAIAQHLGAQAQASPARVAAHHEAAGQWSAAARAYGQAAQQAFARSRRAEQARLLQQAAACHDKAGDSAQAVSALALRVGALVQCDRAAHAAAALELVQRAHTPAERVVAWLARAESQNVTGDFAGVCATLPEAMQLARAAGDTAGEATAARRLAYAMINIGRHADAVSLLEEASPRLLPTLNAVDQAQFLADQSTVLAGSNRRVAAARLQVELVDRLLALGQQSDALTCMTNLGVNLYVQGRLPEALANVRRAIAHPAFAEQSEGIGTGIRLTLGQLLRDLGQFDEALTVTQAVADAARTSGLVLWQAHAENQLAVLWLMLGQPARAWQQVATHPTAELPPFIVAGRWLAQAQVQRVLGRHRPEWLQQGLEVLERGERADVRLRLWAEQCLLQPADGALALASRMRQEADALEMTGLSVLAQARVLQALLRQPTPRRGVGRHQAAREEAEHDLVRRLGGAQAPSVYLAAVWAVVIDAQLQRADAAAARSSLQTALQWLRSVAPHVPEAARRAWQAHGEQHPWLRQQALRLGLPWPLQRPA